MAYSPLQTKAYGSSSSAEVCLAFHARQGTWYTWCRGISYIILSYLMPYLVSGNIWHGNSCESYSRLPFVEALCASLAAFQLFEDIQLS